MRFRFVPKAFRPLTLLDKKRRDLDDAKESLREYTLAAEVAEVGILLAQGRIERLEEELLQEGP